MVPNEEKRKAVAANRCGAFGTTLVLMLSWVSGFYPSVAQFQYFVGESEEDGFRGDIVMAVGPEKSSRERSRVPKESKSTVVSF